MDEVGDGSTGRIMKIQKIKHFKEETFIEEVKFGTGHEVCIDKNQSVDRKIQKSNYKVKILMGVT